MNILRSYRSLVCASVMVLSVTVSGCLPRGETSSLDEVFNMARNRFQVAFEATGSQASASQGDAAAAGAMSVSARANLDRVVKELDVFLRDTTVTGKVTAAGNIHEALSQLTTSAGYTSRPSLSEVSSQYAALAERMESAGVIDASTAKQAAMRAYTVLASELETTKFSL